MTCGDGVRERTRICDSRDKKYCIGANVEVNLCSLKCESLERKLLLDNAFETFD